MLYGDSVIQSCPSQSLRLNIGVSQSELRNDRENRPCRTIAREQTEQLWLVLPAACGFCWRPLSKRLVVFSLSFH